MDKNVSRHYGAMHSNKSSTNQKKPTVADKSHCQLFKKRNNIFQKALRTKKTEHIAKYNSMQNKVVALLQYSKKRLFNHLAKSDKKSFWKSVKVLNKNRDTIPSLTMNNTTAEDDADKANMLNTSFRKCWNQAEPPLSESQYVTNLYDKWYEDANVSPEEVLHLIKGLDVEKASGSDKVSAYMLQATAEYIAPSVAKLFNLSLPSGKFPSIWKEAHVVPIHKSGSKSSASNYGPISLLSVVNHVIDILMSLFPSISQLYIISAAKAGSQRATERPDPPESCSVDLSLSLTYITSGKWSLHLLNTLPCSCLQYPNTRLSVT